MTNLVTVPQELTAGDTWEWTDDQPSYPRTTWTLTYYFEKKDKSFSVAGTGSAGATTHNFSIAAVTTAGYPAGEYRYVARVTDGTTVRTVANGWTVVLVDPAAAGTHDHRSWAQRTLEALEATIEGRATTDQLSVSINGRSISRLTPTELMDWRNRLRAEVRAEEQGENAGVGRNIRVRFANAS